MTSLSTTTIQRTDRKIESDGNGKVAYTMPERVVANFNMRVHESVRGDGHDLSPGTAVSETSWSPIHLEEVRDDVRRRAEADQATDIVRSLPMWMLDYRGHPGLPDGRLAGRYMTSGGWSSPIPFTRRALRQLCRDVLPSRGLGYNDALAGLGEKGEKMATINMSMFIQASDRKPRNVRLHNRVDVDGVVRQTARAVVSESYVTYGDVELLEDLLGLPEFVNLPVLAYRATDSGTRIRFATEQLQGPPVVGRPIEMLEVWNSEVGASSLLTKAGLWTLHCTNGMAGWSESMQRRWNHSGSMRQRVKSELPQAIDEMRVRAAGVVEMYGRALNTAIDDAMAWMDQELSGDLTEERLQLAKGALLNPQSSVSPPGTLARVIDAVTYSAQDLLDIQQQAEVENAGARLMSRGLSRAVNGVIRVPAEV